MSPLLSRPHLRWIGALLLGALASAPGRAPGSVSIAVSDAVSVAAPEARAERERIVDLAAESQGRILGAPGKEQLGNDLQAGDLNADGTRDLVIGAHWGSEGGRNIVGRSYAVFGRETWPARLDLAGPVQGWWSVMGVGREARLGASVAAGDLSGDGVDDLVIGSLLADPYDQANGGAVYAMMGGPDAGGAVDLLTDEPDLLIAGRSTQLDSDRLGTALALADFDGDGHTDLAAAALLRDGFRGAVFGWWGPLGAGTRINLQNGEPDWILEGPAEAAYFGTALAAADLDGDGAAELAVGALKAGGEEATNGGAVHVFRGARWPAVRDLREGDADLTVLGPEAALLTGAYSLGTCSCRGQPLRFADLTGDGELDLLIGAPLDEGRRGAVYLLPGPLGAGRRALAELAHLRVIGGPADDRFGWSLAAGPLDGDGAADLVVAAPWSDAAGRDKAGRVLGLRGPLPGAGTWEVEERAALEIHGPSTSDGDGGLTLAFADTDADGATDLHLGFPDADPDGRLSVGAVYRLAGPLLATLPSPTSSAGASATGTPADTQTRTPTAPTTPVPSPSPSIVPTASLAAPTGVTPSPSSTPPSPGPTTPRPATPSPTTPPPSTPPPATTAVPPPPAAILLPFAVRGR